MQAIAEHMDRKNLGKYSEVEKVPEHLKEKKKSGWSWFGRKK